MLDTTARSVLCQRCTNCSRQYWTADYIQDLTKSKRKIRRDSEALTKQQTILRRTEWLIRNATSGEPKCGPRQSTSWRRSTPAPTNQFGTPSNLAVSNMITSTSWTNCTETRKPQYWQTKKVTFKKWTKLGAPLSSLLFNKILQKRLEEYVPRWQENGRMGICLSDNDHDCFTNMRFAADVLHFASSKEQLQKMLCKFKRITEKVRLRIHSRKTTILSKQSLNIRKEIEIDDIKVEILIRAESTKHLGHMITFQQQETTEIINRIRAAWATFHKNIQGLTSRTYMLRHRLRLFDAVVSPTMDCASGIWTFTEEHEGMIQSTQRNEKDIQ